MSKTFLILGAGLAGAWAAATLRQEGFEGRVVLVGDEPHPPYDRPPLSKEYLRGEREFESTLVRPREFYEENGIETVFGARGTSLDPGTKTVLLEGQGPITYDKLLITTGSRNRALPVPGASLEGIYDLRTRDDADAIRAAVKPGSRVVLVGMGFIGSEVAAALAKMGARVVAVEALETPLFSVLGREIGQVLEEIHRENGVEMILGEGVASFEGKRRVGRVVTSTGNRIECDVAIVGIGVQPATEVAEEAGIEVDNGILVDEYCRTSADDVFAAGDVANHFHPVAKRHLRVEHWQNAIKQGQAAAKNMLGDVTVYDEVHWFWSDQYEHNIQYAGFPGEWQEIVVRGSIEDRKFAAFYLTGGKVVAAAAFNRSRDVRRATPLIKTGTPVEVSVLGDESVDLREMIGAPSS